MKTPPMNDRIIKLLTKQEYWKLWFTTHTHTGGSFFITIRAVRAVIAHAIVVINKLCCGWQPVVLSAIVTYKPYLHIPTSITQILFNVKLQGEQS